MPRMNSYELSREMRRIESQLRQCQKMEALGTLARAIAHDFNNILTTIGGNVDIALADKPPAQIRESLLQIRKASMRAKGLVRRILSVSRYQDSERRLLALAPVVDEAFELIRATLPVTISAKATYVDDLPLIMADASQIHQVVMNLCTNAAHAMKQTGGKLNVDISAIEIDEPDFTSDEVKPGRYVKLSVSDTGKGIDPQDIDRIFDLFFTTKGADGSGLGLAMVSGIVRDSNGVITVDSELGRGSTFSVYFPAAGLNDPALPSSADEPQTA